MAPAPARHAAPPGSGPRTERGEYAYRTLRDLIVHGRIAPGARVAENDVARKLGISRTPIRSALQRLQQEGYIIVTGAGRLSRTFVAPLTREDARQLFDIIAALEGLAAGSAARLPPAARRPIVARMRRLNVELGSLSRSERDDPVVRYENDTAFHRCYVSAAGTRLAALHQAVMPQAERYIRVYIHLLARTSRDEHQAIVEALAGGDPHRARRAAEANWHNAAARLLPVIDQAGEKGSW